MSSIMGKFKNILKQPEEEMDYEDYYDDDREEQNICQYHSEAAVCGANTLLVVELHGGLVQFFLVVCVFFLYLLKLRLHLSHLRRGFLLLYA